MDSVRFGRALGFGARAAAKTLVTAVEAATSPNPATAAAKSKVAPPAAHPPESPPSNANANQQQSRVSDAGLRAGRQTARTTAQVLQTGQGWKRGSKQFGEAVWAPLVKLSGVLWLEVTGVFFGIFALFAAGGVWKLRGAVRGTGANHDAHGHLLLAAVMAAVFGYLCISSFVQANRRGKRS